MTTADKDRDKDKYKDLPQTVVYSDPTGPRGRISVTPGITNTMRSWTRPPEKATGLTVAFAPGTPQDERTRFVDSARLEANKPKTIEALQGLQEAPVTRVATPTVRPLDNSSFGSLIVSAAGQKADLRNVAAHQEGIKTAATVRGIDNEILNKAEQNKIARAKNIIDQGSAEAQQGLWSAQTDERNRENRLATEVYDPTVTPERLAQIEQASQALAGGKAQGAPFRKYDPGTPAIGGLGGTMEGVVEQQPDGTYIKRPVAPQPPEDLYDYKTIDGKTYRRLKPGAK